MAIYSKKVFSGCTNGAALAIGTATTDGGTLVHTAVTATGADQADEIWVWAFNESAADVTINYRHGTATAASLGSIFTVPKQDGLFLVSPGLILNGALTSRCFASASGVHVVGYVNSVVT